MVDAKQILDLQKKKINAQPLEAATAADTLSEINRGFAEKKAIALAQKLKLPYIDILDFPISSDLISKTNADEAVKNLAFPFFQIGKKMKIAVANFENPTTQKYLDKLKSDGLEVHLNIASREGILGQIEKIRALQPRRREEFRNEDAEENLKNYEDEIKNLEQLATNAREISAQASLNRIFIGALRTGASDIHFQPDEQKIDIRFRIDGILQKILEFDHKLGGDITNQLKYASKLRLNVANIPQDGRTSFLAEDRKIDVRVSTLPTEFGESIVCRLLDSGKKTRTFEELGFANLALTNLQNAINSREGMILVTGPTGSGKSTALYTLLNGFNNPERKIATLENPVEYHLKNIVQSQINEDEGYNFADGLRALLRQDPDVLMVGEIRDSDTAETAAQAAMTGHIVLSTLHTNSAVEAIPRLLNLGMKPFLLAASLNLVVAQRLVRQPCQKCAEKIKATGAENQLFEKYFAEIRKNNPKLKIEMPKFLWRTKGCGICGQTGYRGQIVIAESFRMDAEIKKLILAEASSADITIAARSGQGMISFSEDGILKAAAGQTTLAEIARVAGIDLVGSQ
ncbi:type II/IV secretion system protein [Candidatus Gracilibacteria bacterium]|nr:type II/IV secretion system protein [Candidatus Gracilibacteria bacterium]MCF7856561.1 type II/IV secretion system protein [Candidatus Gracilibacteria bacterium]MCF7896850.1 type II/IV secretion system protein [Candidatus Gracilibacteria bacterium]